MDEKEIIDEAVERLRDMASAHQDLEPEARELMNFLDGELPGDRLSPPGWITKDGVTISRQVKYRIDDLPEESRPDPGYPASTDGERQAGRPLPSIQWTIPIIAAWIAGLFVVASAALMLVYFLSGAHWGGGGWTLAADPGSFWIWGIGIFVVGLIFYGWYRRRATAGEAETAAQETTKSRIRKRARPEPMSVPKKPQENNGRRKGAGPAERFARAVAAKDPNYETTVFKCLADYRTCASSRENDKVCVALMAICMAQQIVPFVGKGK